MSVILNLRSLFAHHKITNHQRDKCEHISKWKIWEAICIYKNKNALNAEMKVAILENFLKIF